MLRGMFTHGLDRFPGMPQDGRQIDLRGAAPDGCPAQLQGVAT
jgi:hypothetical protein